MLKDTLKPRSIDDHYDASLVSFIKSQTKMPHMIFHGMPGTGKTEMAHLIGEFIHGKNSLDFIEYNSSMDRGIDLIRGEIREIANANTFESKYKIILLDEAEGLTSEAQTSLRRIMETGKATFILTTNNLSKIIPAIQNRCHIFEFKGPSKEFLMKRTQFLSSVIPDLFEKSIDNSKASYREIFQAYEVLCAGGSLIEDSSKLLEMSAKDFIDFSWSKDPEMVIQKLHREILEFPSKNKAGALIELAEIDYRCSQQTRKVLQLQTGFLKIKKTLVDKKE